MLCGDSCIDHHLRCSICLLASCVLQRPPTPDPQLTGVSPREALFVLRQRSAAAGSALRCATDATALWLHSAGPCTVCAVFNGARAVSAAAGAAAGAAGSDAVAQLVL
jgi:hypothetical protein